MTEADVTYSDALKRAMDSFNVGDIVGGIEKSEAATKLDPARSEAYFLLGCASLELRRTGTAITLFRQVVDMDPDVRDYAEVLGTTLIRLGHLTEGLYYVKLASALQPHPEFPEFRPKAFVQVGAALVNTMMSLNFVDGLRAEEHHDFERALEFAREELQINPGHQDAQRLMARCLNRTGRYAKAASAAKSILHSGAADPQDYRNLAIALLHQGRREDARACIDASIATWPEDAISCLQAMELLPLCGVAIDIDAYRNAASAVSATLATAEQPEPQPPGGPVRIGILSDRLLDDPLCAPLETLIRHLNRRRFQIYIYQQNVTKQNMTRRLSGQVDSWRDVYDIDDESLGYIFRGDELDLLIDMCGMGPGNRITALAGAGVRTAAWLAAGEVAGLPVHHAVIGDRSTVATDRALSAPGQQCIEAPILQAFTAMAPTDITPSPCIETGVVTFGAVADLAMVTPDLAAEWARILKRVPASRLMFGNTQGNVSSTLNEIVELFGCFGVADRVIFQDGMDEETGQGIVAEIFRADFLGAIDILLDGEPISVGALAVDALWSGIPVITRRGEGRVSGIAAGILHAANQPEWIGTDGNYADIAVALASDHDELSRLRTGLRDSVAASPLFDGPAFARGIEDACLKIIEDAYANANDGGLNALEGSP